SDIVCRLGGDEFLVISPRTHYAGAQELARKLIASSLPFHTPSGEACWSGAISVGIAEADSSMNDPEALLAAADRAMYIAKRKNGAAMA
ncbi:MAG: diguanylate cyclase, partial [Aeromonadaceae bacterium]